MDKQSNPNPKSKIMKFLPRAASAVIFHHRPVSPGRCYSGPMKISIVPPEARSKSKNSGFQTPDATSPKVSCIGQIKHKKKAEELMKKRTPAPVKIPGPKKRHPPSVIERILTGGRVIRRAKSNVSAGKPPQPERAPGLSQMKRFSSGRGALGSFDWTAQVASADDVEVQVSAVVWIDEEVGPLQPKKEVNIWKRRTVVPPTPLQL